MRAEDIQKLQTEALFGLFFEDSGKTQWRDLWEKNTPKSFFSLGQNRIFFSGEKSERSFLGEQNKINNRRAKERRNVPSLGYKIKASPGTDLSSADFCKSFR